MLDREKLEELFMAQASHATNGGIIEVIREEGIDFEDLLTVASRYITVNLDPITEALDKALDPAKEAVEGLQELVDLFATLFTRGFVLGLHVGKSQYLEKLVNNE